MDPSTWGDLISLFLLAFDSPLCQKVSLHFSAPKPFEAKSSPPNSTNSTHRCFFCRFFPRKTKEWILILAIKIKTARLSTVNFRNKDNDNNKYLEAKTTTDNEAHDPQSIERRNPFPWKRTQRILCSCLEKVAWWRKRCTLIDWSLFVRRRRTAPLQEYTIVEWSSDWMASPGIVDHGLLSQDAARLFEVSAASQRQKSRCDGHDRSFCCYPLISHRPTLLLSSLFFFRSKSSNISFALPWKKDAIPAN